MTRQDAEPMHLTESTFTPENTRNILETACGIAGFDAASAVVMRHHTNAVYLLAAQPIVVKIGRPDHHGHIDVVGLVRWLQQQAVPTVSLIDTEQPLHISGCPVTFWRYLDQQNRIVSAADLAEPFAKLHACRAPVPVALPDQQITYTFEAISTAIDNNTILSAQDRAMLHERREQLAEHADNIRWVLPRGPIHGDAHHLNALWDKPNECAVLADWENAAIGPPEWDLATLEVHCRRFGHPADEYDRFATSYGFDIRDWSGYRWLRDLRELRMITTNARKSARGSSTAAEVLRRIEALKANAPIGWNIL
ncbi:phosphotransferase family protein [Nocardia iowensis]|uniref:Aminoglycoside phosphotransferase family protein n=1 Tax=Nocardia iowensis TaxID=204891 RepID=A0ABX8RK78_NOCIO|nr:aminoglycoside phosphotransferase family protein [Nocardia iowensis]QXN88830.1 aminoglycoside phosphotransferase family protein [Nocardia iowensis]